MLLSLTRPILIVALLATGLWFVPFASGEERPSPDGGFKASAMNIDQGTFSFRRDQYLEIRVVEVASGRVVWHVTRHHLPNAHVPDYGLRGEKFVVWADDSSAVTIPLDGGRVTTFAVP